MKIGILGSRGIPNEYGGFEQLAEYLSEGLVQKGYSVWVYSPKTHSYQKSEFNGVNLIHCANPEKELGLFGQFIYDLLCILDSRKRNFDIILQLGYTSNAIWNWLFDRNTTIVTNTDGLEWKRKKYHWFVRQFLKFSERIIIRRSHYLIADSRAIREYIQKKYHKNPTFIPYGADPFLPSGESRISHLGLKPYRFYLMAARLQPDNHVEEIIRGVIGSGTDYPLLIAGNTDNGYARKIREKYQSAAVRFAGGIYDQELLNHLRYYSAVYFHGHSAGGTNPSLIEAMAGSCRICAHNNPFNREVLGKNAFFFSTPEDISVLLRKNPEENLWNGKTERNLQKVKTTFEKQKIIDQYADLFQEIHAEANEPLTKN